MIGKPVVNLRNYQNLGQLINKNSGSAGWAERGHEHKYTKNHLSHIHISYPNMKKYKLIGTVGVFNFFRRGVHIQSIGGFS